MSVLDNPFGIVSTITTVITGIIVAILYITTRFGKGETKGAVIHSQTTAIVKSIDEIQEQFKENQKELKTDVRDLSKEVQQLTNTLNLQQYTSTDIKQITSDLQKKVNELERKYYDLDRRVNYRSAVGGGAKPKEGEGSNGGNYWCL